MGLIFLAVGHQVPGALRNEEHEDHDDEARESLEDERELPRQVGADVIGAKGDSGRGNGTAKVTTITDSVWSTGDRDGRGNEDNALYTGTSSTPMRWCHLDLHQYYEWWNVRSHAHLDGVSRCSNSHDGDPNS